MANRTVVIDCDEQGNYSVGEEPHESQGAESAEGNMAEGSEGETNMQPAKSLDDALEMARGILSGGSEDTTDADAAMQKGYENVAGAPGGMA